MFLSKTLEPVDTIVVTKVLNGETLTLIRRAARLRGSTFTVADSRRRVGLTGAYRPVIRGEFLAELKRVKTLIKEKPLRVRPYPSQVLQVLDELIEFTKTAPAWEFKLPAQTPIDRSDTVVIRRIDELVSTYEMIHLKNAMKTARVGKFLDGIRDENVPRNRLIARLQDIINRTEYMYHLSDTLYYLTTDTYRLAQRLLKDLREYKC